MQQTNYIRLFDYFYLFYLKAQAQMFVFRLENEFINCEKIFSLNTKQLTTNKSKRGYMNIRFVHI